VTNRIYGVVSDQHYKDRSVDFKLRLLQEGQYHPSLALGAQDVGGTGLFSSEYLVSNYHYYDLDFSLGLAWGRLGSRGDIRNPLAVFGGDYDLPRQVAQSQGNDQAGAASFSRLFSGNHIGPFGGVAWQTPIRKLTLKLEYDGNNYQEEGLSERFKVDSPINAALNYRPVQGLELQVGYERGNTLSASVNLGLNFQQFKGIPKVADPPPTAVHAAPKPDAATANAAVAVVPVAGAPAAEVSLADPWVLALRRELQRQGIKLSGLSYQPGSAELLVWFQQDEYRILAKAIGRVARAVCATAPASIQSFTVIDQSEGVETYRATIPRAEFEQVALRREPLQELGPKVVITAPESDDALASADLIDKTRYPAFNWDMGPALRQNIGGPDGFFLAQLLWRINGDLALSDRLSLSGSIGLNIVNNFGDNTVQSDSVLPHVRSDIGEYLQHGQNSLGRFEADYIWSPYSSLYARLSGGLFEEMYGGVAGEILWRPFGRPWAIGLDVNHVYQRAYDQLFTFRDYDVTTGFVDLYYQLPFYRVLAKLSVGKYLAGDKGATLDLSREFDNGIRAGIFATRTNVSAERFGEGSFDKGIYISIPLDLFSAKSSRSYGTALFRPLTRDGGQRAVDGKELYTQTRDSDPAAIARGWSEVVK
jgi:hypothetical protein